MNKSITLLFGDKTLEMDPDFVEKFGHFGLEEVSKNTYKFKDKKFESIIGLLVKMKS